MHPRTRAVVLVLAAALPLLGCSSPQAKGTKTNWLRACAGDFDCGAPGSCLCGICTAHCEVEADCMTGTCGSVLASAAQCDGADQGRLCLAEAAGAASACTELPVPAVEAMGAAPPASCERAGALVCESFDAPLPTEYRVGHVEAVTTSIQDCRAYQGSGAIRFQSPSVGWTQVQMPLSTPVAAGPLYARFYAYVASGIPASTYLILLELWPEATEERFSVEVVGDDQMEIYLGPNGTGHAAAAGTLQRDRWMCVELALELAETDGSATLLVDGTPVVEQAAVRTATSTPLLSVIVSALPATDASGVDVTLDELVVATEPIGCD